jgi:hypothetical protein
MESYQDTKKLKHEITSPSNNSSIEILNDDVWTVLGSYMYEAYKNTLLRPKIENKAKQDSLMQTSKPHLPLLKDGLHYKFVDVITEDHDPSVHECGGTTRYAMHFTEEWTLHKIKYFCYIRCNLMLVCKKFRTVFSTIQFDELFWISMKTRNKLLAKIISMPSTKREYTSKLFDSILTQIKIATTSSSQLFGDCKVTRLVCTNDVYEPLVHLPLPIPEDGSRRREAILKEVGWMESELKKARSLEHIDLTMDNFVGRLPRPLLELISRGSKCRKVTVDLTYKDPDELKEIINLFENIKEMKIHLGHYVPHDFVPKGVTSLELSYYCRSYIKTIGTYSDLIERITSNRYFDVLRLDIRPCLNTPRHEYKFPKRCTVKGVKAKRIEIRYDDTNFNRIWNFENVVSDEILFEFDMTDIYLGCTKVESYFNQNMYPYISALDTSNVFKKVIFSVSNNYQIRPCDGLLGVMSTYNMTFRHFELRLSNAPLDLFECISSAINNTRLNRNNWRIVTQTIKQVYDFKRGDGTIIKMCYADLVATK